MFFQIKIFPSSSPCWAFQKDSHLTFFPCSHAVKQTSGRQWGRGEEGRGQQSLWPLHPCCRPVTSPPPAFVNSASMCGLELKQEAFSKAVFCWLRVRLLVCVEWATFICSQVKFVKMAQMPAVPLPQESSCHPLSKPGQAGQPALRSSGSLPECMVLKRGWGGVING